MSGQDSRTLNLEQLCSLPQAGQALLRIHRWLATTAAERAAESQIHSLEPLTAFDMLEAVSRVSADLAAAESMIVVMASNDERATTMFMILEAEVGLTRVEAEAQAMGMDFYASDADEEDQAHTGSAAAKPGSAS